MGQAPRCRFVGLGSREYCEEFRVVKCCVDGR